MKTRQNDIWGFSILLFVIAIGIFMGYRELNGRKTHSAFTTGEIYDVTGLAKSPEVYVRYQYKVRQKVYVGLNSLPLTYKDKHLRPLYRLLLKKSFPVVYDSTDVGNSEILISLKQYDRYKTDRPESLRQLFETYDTILKNN